MNPNGRGGHCRVPACWHGEGGQALVEFAIAVPVFLAMVVGIVAGAILFMQDQSVANAARSATRAAIAQSSLAQDKGDGRLCASGTAADGTPDPIEQAARRGGVVLSVSGLPLCQTGSSNPGGTALVQTGAAPNEASVQLTAVPNISNPARVTVIVTYASHPMWPFSSAVVMLTHSSSLPAQQ